MANFLQIYQLKSNAQFKSRVASAVAKGAYNVLIEPANTTNHSDRLIWAHNAMANAESSAEQMLWSVVQNPIIQANGINSTDSDIELVINGLIDIFADAK